MSADLRTDHADATRAGGLRRRPRARWLVLLAAVLVALLAGGYLLWARTGGDGGDGWKTVWREDFDGTAGELPSRSDWQLDTGTSYPGGAPQWGTGEIQTYTADTANVALDGDGHLKITATRDGAGVWRSARLETTRSDFRAQPGETLKAEARIRVPDGGPGYWAAFWMLGEPFRGDYWNWPGIGEIDVMEFKGSEASNVYGTFHCGVAPGGPCNENNGIGNRTSAAEPLHAGFHTYAVQWDRTTAPEEIRWYLDGKPYHTVRQDQVDAATWSKATDHGFFVLLNLAIGGSFGGPPDAGTRPGASMVVDDVTVSRR
jgi:beta-glucanase (GH16 family)